MARSGLVRGVRDEGGGYLYPSVRRCPDGTLCRAPIELLLGPWDQYYDAVCRTRHPVYMPHLGRLKVEVDGEMSRHPETPVYNMSNGEGSLPARCSHAPGAAEGVWEEERGGWSMTRRGRTRSTGRRAIVLFLSVSSPACSTLLVSCLSSCPSPHNGVNSCGRP